MNWGSFSEFFAMGGYAFYVWGSYAVTCGLLVAEVMSLRSRRRAALSNLGRGNALSQQP